MSEQDKPWWHSHNADHQILEITDDSDCATCTKRNAEQWELLREVRCDLMMGVECMECGRIVDVFVERDHQFD